MNPTLKNYILDALRNINASLEPKTRQCLQCGWTEGEGFCDRWICEFVTLRPCDTCGAKRLDVSQGLGEYAQAFGQTCQKKNGGTCELEERIAANRKACRDRRK